MRFAVVKHMDNTVQYSLAKSDGWILKATKNTNDPFGQTKLSD